MPDVRLPDGKIVRNVPEGITKSQLMAKLNRAGVTTPESFLASAMRHDAKRTDNMRNIADEYVAGNQTYPETLMQFAGQGVALGGDIAAEGLKRTAKGVSYLTPDIIEEPIKRGVKSGLDYVSDSPVGRTARAATDYAVQKYNDFGQQYPRAARNVEAVANIGFGFAPVIGPGGKSAVSATESLAKKGGELALEVGRPIAKTAVKPLAALNEKTIYPVAEEVKKASKGLYEQASKLGAEFSSNVIDDFYESGKKLLPKGGVASSLIKPDAADEFIKSIADHSGKKLSLDDFESLDRHLGELAHDNFSNNQALSRKYTALQAALRESVENPNNIIGSAEGVKAQREAVRLWGVAAKMGDIERIIRNAQYYEVPSTAIKTGFRRIAINEKLLRGYTKAERRAIERAAKSGRLDGVFKTFGSRLMAIAGAAVGGAPGAAVGYGVSSGGRIVSESIKRGQAGEVAKELGRRSGMTRKEKRF